MSPERSSINQFLALGQPQDLPGNDVEAKHTQKIAEEHNQWVDKLGGQSPEEEKEYLERQLSYERFIEDAEARINSTTLPWEARMAVRDVEFQFIDAPPGLGDNWGLQRLYNFLDTRATTIRKLTAPEEAKKALGFEEEPWRNTHLISRQDRTALVVDIMNRNPDLSKNSAEYAVDERERRATERAPFLATELTRSREELALTRKLIFLWWGWNRAASGKELGDLYLENKLPSLPAPKDFAHLLQFPSYFVSGDEILNPENPTMEASGIPGYPKIENISAFLKVEKRATENEPLGKTTEKMMRILYAVALSDNPERLIEWKLKAEQGKLEKILLEKDSDINPAYLILREKVLIDTGIVYRDQEQEELINNVIESLSTEEKKEVENAWWNQLGFENAQDGIEMIGDPLSWIPYEARRGAESLSVGGALKDVSFNREARVTAIEGEMLSLRRLWENLSPLNNNTPDTVKEIKKRIAARIESLRKLQTIDSDKGKMETVISTLSLENELKVRGKATKLGCVWARPQNAQDKEELFKVVLPALANNDRMAFQMAEATVGLFGIPAKNGFNMRDFDPTAPKFSDARWKVDVEGWPYTSELQVIMALDKYSRYKVEAFGPDGSRNRFGPLMTDYLTANVVKDYDPHGNELFIICDSDGTIKKGRADEGVVLTGTTRTLMEDWEKGISLSEEKIWENVQEDPFRRFILRSFFAEGKAALGPGGNALIDIWRKKEFDLERDLNEKFLDDYKLARRVALRKELEKESIWKDIVSPIDEEYRRSITKCLTKLNAANSADEKRKILKEYSSLYVDWDGKRWKEVFDYVDQTWWNGVLMSSSARNWDEKEQEIVSAQNQKLGTFIANRPSRTLMRFFYQAETRGVKLFGKYSIDRESMPSVMQKVFDQSQKSRK